MHETNARGWYTGKTQKNRLEREVGGGIRMGNTCNSMAYINVWQKPLQYCKAIILQLIKIHVKIIIIILVSLWFSMINTNLNILVVISRNFDTELLFFEHTLKSGLFSYIFLCNKRKKDAKSTQPHQFWGGMSPYFMNYFQPQMSLFTFF